MRARIMYLLVVVLGCSATFANAQMPVELFAKYPDTYSAKISPLGDYLAVVKTVKVDDKLDKTVLVVFKFPSMAHSATLSFPKNNNVGGFFWVNDERVLVTITQDIKRLEQDVYYGELFGMNADGTERTHVFGFRAGFAGSHSVVHLLPDDPKHILIATYNWRSGRRSDVALRKMDVYDGSWSTIARAPKLNASFMADSAGELRYAFSRSDENALVIDKFDSKSRSWSEFSVTRFGQGGSLPLAIYPDPQHVIVREAFDDGPFGIYSLDLTTNRKTELYRHQFADAQLLADVAHKPWGARIWPGYPEFVALDNEHPNAQLMLEMQSVFPRALIQISSTSRDYRYSVISVSRDVLPAVYYLFDRKKAQLRELFKSRPWLHGLALATVRPITFEARDGVTIRGLVTVPNDSDGKQDKPAGPMVVMPHGGPFGISDRWGFDSDAQLLASRGFTVLQVNFRGSGGYGPQFEGLGIGEWGDKMQDDVTDATLWAINQGYADANRVCIYGWSHGGYAALRGAQKEPKLYRCAVGAAGVYDFALQYRKADYSSTRSGRSYMRQTLGKDKAEIRRISPVRHADDIEAAVMLVHGGKDARVPIGHARAMRKALKKAGKPPKYLEKPREGHGFFNESNRVDFYNELLNFLEAHIGEKTSF